MSRFFYLEDRPDAPPCDQNLLHARSRLRELLDRDVCPGLSDGLTRAIDALIAAHVADYAYKHPQSYNDVGMRG